MKTKENGVKDVSPPIKVKNKDPLANNLSDLFVKTNQK